MTETSDSAFCNVFFLTGSLRYLFISDSEVSAASLKAHCIAGAGCEWL